MKRLSVLSGMFLLVFGLTGTSGAYTIDYFHDPDGIGGYTTKIASTTVETFDASSLFWTWTGGSFNVVSGSTSLNAAPDAPLGGGADSTKYVTVPMNTLSSSSGFVDVTNLGGPLQLLRPLVGVRRYLQHAGVLKRRSRGRNHHRDRCTLPEPGQWQSDGTGNEPLCKHLRAPRFLTVLG